MIPGKWAESPPSHTPFYPCWATNGEHVFLASWRDGEWKIGQGLAFTPDEVTHYQILKAPEPPNLIQEKSVSNEVNYADL